MTSDRFDDPSRREWEVLADDPDPQRDLGYDLDEWEVIVTESPHERLVFLPDETDMLRDDAFIVAATDAVRDLLDCV